LGEVLSVEGASLALARTAVHDNLVGGIRLQDAQAALRNVLIADQPGDAIVMDGSTTLRVDHGTISGNVSALVLTAPAGSIEIDRSILWDNFEGLVLLAEPGALQSSCNLTQDGRLAGLVADPLLGPSTRGRHRLRAG